LEQELYKHTRNERKYSNERVLFEKILMGIFECDAKLKGGRARALRVAYLQGIIHPKWVLKISLALAFIATSEWSITIFSLALRHKIEILSTTSSAFRKLRNRI
jgi:hypothetical protein